MTTSTATPTIRVHKAVQAIHIAPSNGPLTFFMRKAYNVLLKLASERWRQIPLEERERLLDEMAEKYSLADGLQLVPAFIFRCKMADITAGLGYDRRNAAAVRKALIALRSCEVRWNMLLPRCMLQDNIGCPMCRLLLVFIVDRANDFF